MPPEIRFALDSRVRYKHHYEPEEKRSWWGEGPWVMEADEGWGDLFGIDIFFKRMVQPNGFCGAYGGHLCVHARLEKGHPWHTLGGDKVHDISVHGGVAHVDYISCAQGLFLGLEFCLDSDSIPSQISFNDAVVKSIQEEYGEDVEISKPVYRTIPYAIHQMRNLARIIHNRELMA